MRQSIINRLWLYVFYASCAVLFWLFDLRLFAWISAAIVIAPIIVGGIIWACDPDVTKREKAEKKIIDILSKKSDQSNNHQIKK